MNNPEVLKALIAGLVTLAGGIFAIHKTKTKITKRKQKTKGYPTNTTKVN